MFNEFRILNNYFLPQLAVLKAHMLTHTNKRDYTCLFEGCTYAFKTKGSLKRHMRRHTGLFNISYIFNFFCTKVSLVLCKYFTGMNVNYHFTKYRFYVPIYMYVFDSYR